MSATTRFGAAGKPGQRLKLGFQSAAFPIGCGRFVLAWLRFCLGLKSALNRR
jgi:hypothetical protein